MVRRLVSELREDSDEETGECVCVHVCVCVRVSHVLRTGTGEFVSVMEYLCVFVKNVRVCLLRTCVNLLRTCVNLLRTCVFVC